MSRWRHYRAAVARQARGRGRDTIALALLVAVAIVMTLYIFSQQKASVPSWAPFVGEDLVELSAQFTNAQAMAPGQGQGVYISGVQVGKVGEVELEDGRAVVGMEVDPKYLELIKTDATLLLRPKTGLNDMTIEVDPGTATESVEVGHQFPLSRTEPAIQLESTLATLDADTRQYLQLLLASGAEGVGGRGTQLSKALRRLQPFSHYVADINRAVAQRRQALKRVIHNFALLTTELGSRDSQIERFVTSSKLALGDFAGQQESIQETLAEFPATLGALRSSLVSANELSVIARPALLGLIPQAQELGPALEATERLFDQTTGPIRDQIRPFTREIRPVVRETERGANGLEKTVRGFGGSLTNLNSFLNTLAYDPKGKPESNLYYLAWLNHNLNASFLLSDSGGPILRSLPMISCNATDLAYGVAPLKPYLITFLRAARVPSPQELPPIPADPGNPQISCGPNS